MNTFYLAIVLIAMPGEQPTAFIDGTSMYESKAECIVKTNEYSAAFERDISGSKVTVRCVRLYTGKQENGIES